MSTYNGHQFLSNQLDSLYSQKNVDIHLLIRDDGSKDDTIDILNAYRRKYGNMDILAESNVGAANSFFKLIKVAAKAYRDYDYFAFSDQDDYWFEDKVITGVRAMDQSSAFFKLFYSNAISTDEKLHPLHGYTIKSSNTFGSNLIANHILGCTMIFNLALLDEINIPNISGYTIKDGKLPLHDAWTAIVAYSLNADVIQGSTATMYYRQHDNNFIGSSTGFFTVQWNRIKRYSGTSSHLKANKCIMALQLLNEKIPEENRKLLYAVSDYRNHWKSKMALLCDKQIYGKSILDNLGTILIILLNKF